MDRGLSFYLFDLFKNIFYPTTETRLFDCIPLFIIFIFCVIYRSVLRDFRNQHKISFFLILIFVVVFVFIFILKIYTVIFNVLYLNLPK